MAPLESLFQHPCTYPQSDPPVFIHRARVPHASTATIAAPAVALHCYAFASGEQSRVCISEVARFVVLENDKDLEDSWSLVDMVVVWQCFKDSIQGPMQGLKTLGKTCPSPPSPSKI